MISFKLCFLCFHVSNEKCVKFYHQWNENQNIDTKKYQRVDPRLRDWASLGLWRCRPPIVSYITTWNMTNMISKLYFKILSLKIPQVLSHITGKFGRTVFPWIPRDRNTRRGHLSWNSWPHSYKDWRHSQLKNGKQTVHCP